MKNMLITIFELAYPNQERKEPLPLTASSWITVAILCLLLTLAIGFLS